jgi:hypothetical protein
MLCICKAHAYVSHVRGSKIKVSVGGALAGLAGPHPLPLSSPLHREGELLMGHVLPGNCERGGGLHWRVYLAGINGDSIGRTKVATRFGGPKWQLFLADQNGGPFGQFNLGTPEGGSIWLVYSAGFVKGKARV